MVFETVVLVSLGTVEVTGVLEFACGGAPLRGVVFFHALAPLIEGTRH
jgi:hypothetical protein